MWKYIFGLILANTYGAHGLAALTSVTLYTKQKSLHVAQRTIKHSACVETAYQGNAARLPMECLLTAPGPARRNPHSAASLTRSKKSGGGDRLGPVCRHPPSLGSRRIFRQTEVLDQRPDADACAERLAESPLRTDGFREAGRVPCRVCGARRRAVPSWGRRLRPFPPTGRAMFPSAGSEG